MKKEFVIGVTGASGVIYARRLLEVLCDRATVHIVVSDTARQIAGIEPAPDATVVVMGDMNSTADAAPVQILTGDRLGLKDARQGAAVCLTS